MKMLAITAALSGLFTLSASAGEGRHCAERSSCYRSQPSTHYAASRGAVGRTICSMGRMSGSTTTYYVVQSGGYGGGQGGYYYGGGGGYYYSNPTNCGSHHRSAYRYQPTAANHGYGYGNGYTANYGYGHPAPARNYGYQGGHGGGSCAPRGGHHGGGHGGGGGAKCR